MMKLNPDSIRSILLYLEEFQSFGDQLSNREIAQNILNKEGCTHGFEDDLLYAIHQLVENNMIKAVKISVSSSTTPNYIVTDITPFGHEFLSNIHNEQIWNKTKEKAKSIGSLSIMALSEISKQLIMKAIVGS